MKKLMIVLLLTAGVSEAALVDRGGGFIYDDVRDITWLQDAGLSGAATWSTQVEWAANLSVYDPVRDVVWDDWRLATINQMKTEFTTPDDLPVDCESATEAACRVNELGYLFWQYGVRPGVSSTSHPFQNVQDFYWPGDSFVVDTITWRYDMRRGTDFVYRKESWSFYGWAVRDGDVASVVPVPAAAWLLGSALIGLGWFGRRAS